MSHNSILNEECGFCSILNFRAKNMDTGLNFQCKTSIFTPKNLSKSQFLARKFKFSKNLKVPQNRIFGLFSRFRLLWVISHFYSGHVWIFSTISHIFFFKIISIFKVLKNDRKIPNTFLNASKMFCIATISRKIS